MNAQKPHESKRKVDAVSALAIALNRETSPEFFRVFIEIGLADVPAADVEAACHRAILVCKFMPSVAELLELCQNAVETDSDAAAAGWESVNRAVRRVGYYGSPTFRDPVVAAAIHAMGGWMRLCNCHDGDEGEKSTDWETWTRKRFIEEYTRLARHGAGSQPAVPLVGFCDRQNLANGCFDFVSPQAMPALDAPEQKRIGAK